MPASDNGGKQECDTQRLNLLMLTLTDIRSFYHRGELAAFAGSLGCIDGREGGYGLAFNLRQQLAPSLIFQICNILLLKIWDLNGKLKG